MVAGLPSDQNGVAAHAAELTDGTSTQLQLDTALADVQVSQARLSLAIGIARLGVFEWDTVSGAVQMDAKSREIFGLAAEGPVHQEEVFSRLAKIDEVRAHALAENAEVNGADVIADYRVTRPDGTTRTILSASEPLKDDGGPLRMIGVFHDVTAIRQAEADLRLLNADLEKQVIERTQARGRTWALTPDLMGALNTHGFFETSNPAWESTLGWTAEELARTPLLELVHPDDRHSAAKALKALADGAPVLRFENRCLSKGAEYRWLSWVAVSEDDIVYCTARDVTAQKRSELELETAQEALRQAQKLEAVGQLTGGVAHDFNNLLTIFRSSVDFLRRPDLDAVRKERYLNAMSDTVDRGAKLTAQLLAFARRQALNPETVDVGARLRVVAELLETAIGVRISIEMHLPDSPCFAKVDVSQFETALVNIAVNARDAMDGEGVLTLKLTGGVIMPPIRGEIPIEGPYVAIAVRDTGSGISDDVLAQIFEPFFTTKEVGKGTGLGLSQVFGFAKQSGGDVDVQSEPGKGTTFTLYLPEVSPDANANVAVGRDDALDFVKGGQHVLVVEDNLEVGQFATLILQDLGYQATWAASAEDALDRLGDKSADFDVVFSDVVMPGMGGVELARVLKHLKPNLPVVLASGYSQVLAEEGVGGFELLQKPYSADQLSNILRKVLRRHGSVD